MAEPGDDGLDEALNPEQIRERATRGAILLMGRGVLIRGLGFLGNIVLARLLLPEDFGLIAFGLTLWTVGSFLQDGGLGAHLIRRAEAPDRQDLQALVGFQLAVTLAMCAVVAALALPLWAEAGAITAVMVASLPLQAPRTANVIVLERRLAYGRIAAVELFEVVVYNAAAVALVVAGMDAWGVAVAFVLRALAGTVLMAIIGPAGVVMPRLDFARVRGWLRFGVQYQSVAVVHLIRDQGLNVGVAAVAGLSTLGVFVLSVRLLQVISLMFESLWRVSYPAMAQLLRAGENARPAVSRIAGLTSIASGFGVIALVGTAPALIPALFGEEWRAVNEIIPWAGAGLLVAGPVSVACAGYLFAVGDAGAVLRGAVIHTAVAFLLALPLLPVLDATSLGIALFAASAVEAVVLGRATAARTGWRPVRELLPPTALAAVATAAGFAIAYRGEETLLVAALALAVGVAVFCAGIAAFQRATAVRLVGIVRGLAARASAG